MKSGKPDRIFTGIVLLLYALLWLAWLSRVLRIWHETSGNAHFWLLCFLVMLPLTLLSMIRERCSASVMLTVAIALWTFLMNIVVS
jgi:hypothetical protein